MTTPRELLAAWDAWRHSLDGDSPPRFAEDNAWERLLALFETVREEAVSVPAPAPKQPTVWQYSLPSVKGRGWAHVVIRSDGFFAAVSDWGNFAHGWWHHGHGGAREFFLRMERDWDYFARKLACECREKVDEDKSIATLKREMLRARRDGNLTREKAAEDWENFETHGDDWEGLVRERWNFTDEPWEYAVNVTSRAEWFVKKIGPRLVKAIREQLDAEAAIASRPLGEVGVMCKDAKPHELCKSGCLVELHPGCWLAKTDGDPGRTLVEASAQRFKTAAAARGALTRARKYRPYKAARIVEVES